MSMFRAAAALEKTAVGFQAYLDALDDTSAVYITNVDEVEGSGFYQFNSTAIGNPRPPWDGRMIHIEEANGEASQIAIMSGSGIYFRDRDQGDSDPNQEWGEWNSIYEPTKTYIIGQGDQVFDPSWILSANLFGGTAITVGNYKFEFARTRDGVHLSGFMDVTGFSQVIPTDTSWNFGVDLGAIAVAAGAFVNIENEPLANSNAQFLGGGGDSQVHTIYSIVQNKTDAVPNEIYFAGGQTDTGGVGGRTDMTADKVVIRVTAQFRVSD